MNDSRVEGLELRIGRVLRLGIRASSVCFAIGLVLMLADAETGLARLLSLVGLVILLATPVARVIMSSISYLRERDWLFVSLTLIVLVELAASVVAALFGGAR
jgi:uncharacterized membrane protein